MQISANAGLVLGPMHFAAEDAKGLQYIPSMALGAALAVDLLSSFYLPYIPLYNAS